MKFTNFILLLFAIIFLLINKTGFCDVATNAEVMVKEGKAEIIKEIVKNRLTIRQRFGKGYTVITSGNSFVHLKIDKYAYIRMQGESYVEFEEIEAGFDKVVLRIRILSGDVRFNLCSIVEGVDDLIISTPTGDVVYADTDFAVKVKDADSTVFYAIKGKVIIAKGPEELIVIDEGQLLFKDTDMVYKHINIHPKLMAELEYWDGQTVKVDFLDRERQKHIKPKPKVKLKWDRKNPWIAGILSTVIPGAGQFYTGRIPQGLYIIIGEGALATQLVYSLRTSYPETYSKPNAYVIGGLLGAMHIYNIIEAAVSAEWPEVKDQFVYTPELDFGSGENIFNISLVNRF